MATEVTIVIRLEFEDPNFDELVNDIESIEYVSVATVVDVEEV